VASKTPASKAEVWRATGPVDQDPFPSVVDAEAGFDGQYMVRSADGTDSGTPGDTVRVLSFSQTFRLSCGEGPFLVSLQTRTVGGTGSSCYVTVCASGAGDVWCGSAGSTSETSTAAMLLSLQHLDAPYRLEFSGACSVLPSGGVPNLLLDNIQIRSLQPPASTECDSGIRNPSFETGDTQSWEPYSQGE